MAGPTRRAYPVNAPLATAAHHSGASLLFAHCTSEISYLFVQFPAQEKRRGAVFKTFKKRRLDVATTILSHTHVLRQSFDFYEGSVCFGGVIQYKLEIN